MAETTWQGELPLFYKNPQLLNSARHAEAGLTGDVNFAFARDTNSVPLGADEVFAAQAYYPIVFTESDPAIPVAVLGIGSVRNTFVDSEGAWRPGTYIPAYIRRYPFILAGGRSPGEFMLAIDEAAANFSMSSGRKLFEGDAPTDIARRALEFCRAYQLQFDISRNFGEALRVAGLLVSKRADVRRPDGNQMSLAQFRIIDETRFDALPNETFLAWRRNGWLPLVYAHLLSMRRWQDFAA